MQLSFYDAHNHLQDERLAPHLKNIVDDLPGAGVTRMVVNGSSEGDWQRVTELARSIPQVIPSFGYHPWYVKERTDEWKTRLVRCLDSMPSAIGEIGLDKWIPDHDLSQQEEVFLWQLKLAAERNLPVSIHCLKAWGRVLELLQNIPLPECGFVLHSFGGSRELVEPLAKLGAYFSLPGYFAQPRKMRQRETFKCVPLERLLLETDAPDQPLPPERVEFPLPYDPPEKPINHPANIGAVYRFAAELRQESIESLALQVAENFNRVFGGILRRS